MQITPNVVDETVKRVNGRSARDRDPLNAINTQSEGVVVNDAAIRARNGPLSLGKLTCLPRLSRRQGASLETCNP